MSRTVRNPWGTILRRRYRPQLIISIMIPIFQQWVGINAIIFYAPRELQCVLDSINGWYWCSMLSTKLGTRNNKTRRGHCDSLCQHSGNISSFLCDKRIAPLPTGWDSCACG